MASAVAASCSSKPADSRAHESTSGFTFARTRLAIRSFNSAPRRVIAVYSPHARFCIPVRNTREHAKFGTRYRLLALAAGRARPTLAVFHVDKPEGPQPQQRCTLVCAATLIFSARAVPPRPHGAPHKPGAPPHASLQAKFASSARKQSATHSTFHSNPSQKKLAQALHC